MREIAKIYDATGVGEDELRELLEPSGYTIDPLHDIGIIDIIRDGKIVGSYDYAHEDIRASDEKLASILANA